MKKDFLSMPLLIDMAKTGNSGINFWTGLLSILYNGKIKCTNKCELLQYFFKREEFHFFTFDENSDGLERFSSLGLLIAEAGRDLATDFRGVVIGRLPILVAELKESGVKEEQLENLLDSSEDPTVQFFKLNDLRSTPYIVVPQSQVQDRFITFTEAAIIRHLLDPGFVYEHTRIHSKPSAKGEEARPSWLKETGKRNCEYPPGLFLKALFGDSLGGRFRCCLIDQHDPELDSKKNR